MLHVVQGVKALMLTRYLVTATNSSLAIQIYLRNMTFYVHLGRFVTDKMHHGTAVQAREGSDFRPGRCLSIQSPKARHN